MWFWYAVMSAMVSGVSIVLNKKALKNINPALVSWALFSFSIPFLIYPAFKNGWPKLNLNFFIFTGLSIVGFAYAKTLSLRSLKNSSIISEILPLAFFAVFVQYILGLLFLQEKLRLVPFLGLSLIISGGYILKVKEAHEDFLKPFKVIFHNKEALFYLLAMIIMPVTTLFDKIGLLNIQPANQSFLLLWENLLTTILLTGYMVKKDKNWTINLRNNFWPLFINGIIYTVLALLFLYGITTGSLALVSGVKKLEILFALLLGWFLFKDKPRKEVWMGSLIMFLGVLLIKLG